MDFERNKPLALITEPNSIKTSNKILKIHINDKPRDDPLPSWKYAEDACISNRRDLNSISMSHPKRESCCHPKSVRKRALE